MLSASASRTYQHSLYVMTSVSLSVLRPQASGYDECSITVKRKTRTELSNMYFDYRIYTYCNYRKMFMKCNFHFHSLTETIDIQK